MLIFNKLPVPMENHKQNLIVDHYQSYYKQYN